MLIANAQLGQDVKNRAGFWYSWQRQAPDSRKKPVSRAHLTLEERIGIEVFAHMGMSAEQLLPALARHHSTISSKLRQGGAKSGQTRLLRPDC